jgi:hypothetical protein
VDDAPQTLEATPTLNRPLPTDTSPPLPTLIAAYTPTPFPTPTPPVRIHAVNGNLHIRRGPGTEYNRIGLLKSGESARVIGQDVLSKWVQVEIPGSDAAGWVSLLTPFTQIEGDLSTVESFTFTDWPQPAYIKNCTEHDLLIGPGDLYLYSLWFNPQYWNEVQVDPGTYSVYDLFVPDEPLIQIVDIREGETVYITVNGLGVYHNCPEEH